MLDFFKALTPVIGKLQWSNAEITERFLSKHAFTVNSCKVLSEIRKVDLMSSTNTSRDEFKVETNVN